MPSGILKILLTRGPGGRGYRCPARPSPTRVISLHELSNEVPDFQDKGVVVRLCHTPLSIQPRLAGLKHCNRLEQVLASLEWNDPQIQEGWMSDTEGYLVEGTRTNLFFLKQESLFTPLLDRCGVRGVVRQWVLQQATSRGLRIQETRIRPEEIFAAEEVFVTNSIWGIVPVVELRDPTHCWLPGKLTRVLQRAWEAMLHAQVQEQC